jgi:hypothetical protein
MKATGYWTLSGVIHVTLCSWRARPPAGRLKQGTNVLIMERHKD